jgi:hypothetical protein
MRFSEKLKAERLYVERRLTGCICDRCHATLATYAEKCPARLDEICPGFVAIEAAKAEFNLESRRLLYDLRQSR